MFCLYVHTNLKYDATKNLYVNISFLKRRCNTRSKQEGLHVIGWANKQQQQQNSISWLNNGKQCI